jgi:hypothetical protein
MYVGDVRRNTIKCSLLQYYQLVNLSIILWSIVLIKKLLLTIYGIWRLIALLTTTTTTTIIITTTTSKYFTQNYVHIWDVSSVLYRVIIFIFLHCHKNNIKLISSLCNFLQSPATLLYLRSSSLFTYILRLRSYLNVSSFMATFYDLAWYQTTRHRN